MSSLRRRFAALDRGQIDAVFAVVMIIELELEAWLTPGLSHSQRVVTALASVFFAAPIAYRRRSPSAALLFCVSVAAIQTLCGGQLLQNANGDTVPVIVLSYSVGAWLDLRASVRAVLLAFAVLMMTGFLPGDGGSPTDFANAAPFLAFVSLLAFPAWFVGRLLRERGKRADAFAELAEQAGIEQQERDAVAIAQERARIGAELQDIIAHSVSAMVIQAGGARALLGSDPARARASMLNVEQTGRDALADLRRLLGMLRKDDDPRALAPQPGLAQLAALLDSLREAGLDCQLRTVGTSVDLTPGVDLVAYRVIEEALRCVTRHGTRRAIVCVDYNPDALGVEVRARGPIPDLELDRGKIAQRVVLYEGSLAVVPVGVGNYTVRALLPLRMAVAA
jgi:signal transduction histidine kinase